MPHRSSLYLSYFFFLIFNFPSLHPPFFLIISPVTVLFAFYSSCLRSALCLLTLSLILCHSCTHTHTHSLSFTLSLTSSPSLDLFHSHPFTSSHSLSFKHILSLSFMHLVLQRNIQTLIEIEMQRMVICHQLDTRLREIQERDSKLAPGGLERDLG